MMPALGVCLSACRSNGGCIIIVYLSREFGRAPYSIYFVSCVAMQRIFIGVAKDQGSTVAIPVQYIINM